jgi:hypothetical protein
VTALEHLDDDRLLALMDGEASSVEVEHAGGCADCQARLAAWQQVQARIAVPPAAAPPEQREAAIAAALAAAPPGGITSLDERRRRRLGHLTAARAAAIVAVVALAAGVGVGAADLAGRGGSSHVSSSARSSASTVPGSSVGPQARAASPGPVQPAAPSGEESLGSIASPAQLTTAVRDRLGGEPQPAASGSSVASALCVPLVAPPAAAGPARLVLTAVLTYQGVPSTVFVFAVGGHHVAVVVDHANCGVLARVTF